MASKSQNQSAEKGKVKLRFFEIELEGGDATLLEGIKSVAAAINRVPTVRQASHLPPRSSAPTPGIVVQSSVGSSNASETTVEADDGELCEPDVPIQVPNKKADPPRRPRAQAIPKQLEELQLSSGTPNWREFAERFKDSSSIDKAVAMAVWLKEQRDVVEFSKDHLYTCFRFLRWPTPDDVGQPLRNAKQQDYFASASKGHFKLTMIGQNRFDDMSK